MAGALYRIEPLAAHVRAGFDSGSEPLNRYFHQQVTQDVRRRVATCFVAVAVDGAIAGFYTLASSSVHLRQLPGIPAKKMPRYPLIPAVRMGRLAVARALHGRGLGGALLADALQRASAAEIAAFALVVDAKDEAAARFYAHHGFIALPDAPLTLFLPFATYLAAVR
jgi:GNAT superfamily N-acetyltransferase